jgi:hypothetical protein
MRYWKYSSYCVKDFLSHNTVNWLPHCLVQIIDYTFSNSNRLCIEVFIKIVTALLIVTTNIVNVAACTTNRYLQQTCSA